MRLGGATPTTAVRTPEAPRPPVQPRTEARPREASAEPERRGFDTGARREPPTLPPPAAPGLADELRSRRSAIHATERRPNLDGALDSARLGDGEGTRGAERAARGVYRTEGRTMHDLSDRADVERLIQASPQIDNLDGTRSDRTRCAAASALNAMLYDGDFRANADAIERTAGEAGRRLSRDERTALDHMREGHLSPRDAARLQTVLYDTGRGLDGDRSGAPGMNGREITQLVSHLRANGGYPNTERMRFTWSEGDGILHATVTHTDRAGREAYADSWPGEDGRATAHAGAGGPGEMSVGGMPNTDLRGDLTVERRGDDRTYYRVRVADETDYVEYRQTETTVPNGTRLDRTADYGPVARIPF